MTDLHEDIAARGGSDALIVTETIPYLTRKVEALREAVARVQADPVRDRDIALGWISDDLGRIAAVLNGARRPAITAGA